MPADASRASFDALLLLLKARKGRSVLLVLAFFLLSFVIVRSSPVDHPWASPTSQSNPLQPSEAVVPSASQDAKPSSPIEADHHVSSSVASSVPQAPKPAFHLLLQPASPNPNFCKAVLSATLLDYPPPTVIGYNYTDSASILELVHHHLQDPDIQDDDLVLLVNGNRVWFQLPPAVLISQYQEVLDAANVRLIEKYGLIKPERAGEFPRPRYTQSIVFGAMEQCWPNFDTDAACAAVPDSPISQLAGGRSASNRNRVTPIAPKHLAAGTVIGPARELRALYAIASLRREGDRSKPSPQETLASMFGEQEYVREQDRRARMSAFAVWAEKMSTFFSRQSSDPMQVANVTLSPTARYEFGIGLDYSSQLFQTLATPRSFGTDIRFKDEHASTPNNSTTTNATLPHPLERLQSPFALLPAEHVSASAGFPNTANPLALNPNLDSLPDGSTSWPELSLARNTHTGATPALLSFPVPEPPPPRRTHRKTKRLASDSDAPATPGDPSPDVPQGQSEGSSANAGSDTVQYIDPAANLWTRLWFQPHARALLRRVMRASTATELIHEMEDLGDTTRLSSPSTSSDNKERHHAFSRDTRGGRGGIWTPNAEWYAWGDVCAGGGIEDAIFRDGKGVWLEELKEAGEIQADVEIRKQLSGWAPVFEGTPSLWRG